MYCFEPRYDTGRFPWTWATFFRALNNNAMNKPLKTVTWPCVDWLGQNHGPKNFCLLRINNICFWKFVYWSVNHCIKTCPLFGNDWIIAWITALFNNKRTLKLKAQPTNAFFAAVNQVFGGSSQLTTTAELCSLSELCTTIWLPRARQ